MERGRQKSSPFLFLPPRTHKQHIHTNNKQMSQLGITHTFDFYGKELSIETGKLAKQADGSVVIKLGGTMLLATVVSSKQASEGIDFLPLTVDYREKFPAAGKFPGGFIKRETRPSDGEILTSRLVDRAIRPLFPKNYHCGTQMLISLISYDGINMPDALAGFAASAALSVSDIPFAGPISEVRVGRLNGEFIINPEKDQIDACDMDMIIAGTADSILMVEGEMKEVSEKEMLEAIAKAHEAIKIQCDEQSKLAAQIEKAQVKREVAEKEEDEELKNKMQAACYNKLKDVAKSGTAKHERKELFNAVYDEFVATLSEEEAEEKGGLISRYFHDIEKEAVRNTIIEDGVRLDGRKTNEIRAIWSEVNYLPMAHGSAVFTRGETQSLTSVTLGTKLDEQNIDGAVHSTSEKFMLHYNFPPFSTGEERPMRGTSRREVGHGNLALRALKPMIPTGEANPYTIRVVSDILESNGSSSMATVCAGSMALMDAGVGIKKPVSGIAMGLILRDENSFAVLSDILGDEDHLGDMDFKVTGTQDGITACQMDIKVGGLTFEILEKALNQAREGRLHILGEMNKTITQPREDYKPHAPRIIKITIPGDMIGAVIGPGGKVIQEIQKESGATITIEEVNGKGEVSVSAANKDAIDQALNRIKGIVAIPEVGEIYEGKVKNVASYGAFIEILPGKDGLLHISEIDWKRIENVSDIMTEGDKIQVKLIGVDPKTGKLKLSRKVLLPKPEKTESEEQPQG